MTNNVWSSPFMLLKFIEKSKISWKSNHYKYRIIDYVSIIGSTLSKRQSQSWFLEIINNNNISKITINSVSSIHNISNFYVLINNWIWISANFQKFWGKIRFLFKLLGNNHFIWEFNVCFCCWGTNNNSIFCLSKFI